MLETKLKLLKTQSEREDESTKTTSILKRTKEYRAGVGFMKIQPDPNRTRKTVTFNPVPQVFEVRSIKKYNLPDFGSQRTTCYNCNVF